MILCDIFKYECVLHTPLGTRLLVILYSHCQTSLSYFQPVYSSSETIPLSLYPSFQAYSNLEFPNVNVRLFRVMCYCSYDGYTLS